MRRKYVSKLKFIFALCLGAIYVLSQLPVAFYGWVGAGLALAFFCWAVFRLFVKSEKYIDSRGYVVLRKFNELEHRYVAKQLLKRELIQNEVVHHINGKKTDNQIENLCLMDREKHEHFHAWLMWKNKKSGRYPTIKEQKRILESDYDGMLLENIPTQSKSHASDLRVMENHEARIPRQNVGDSWNSKTESSTSDLNFIRDEELATVQGKLFEELRTLRKKIAEDKNIPVYMVFDNRTLAELAEQMPDSEAEMLEIWGVGPIKMQMYGTHFLNAIKRIKQNSTQINRLVRGNGR